MISVGRLRCSYDDIDLSTVLRCGQAFRWWFHEGSWFGTIRECLWCLRQDEGSITCLAQGPGEETQLSVIEDYLQLNRADIPALYTRWSAEDPAFRAALQQHKGVRVLRQDPVETLFAFICSSNNNIARITLMLSRLCERYGTLVETRDCPRRFYTFPRVSALSQPRVQDELRALGFGYRAAFVQRSAAQVEARGGATWLLALRGGEYSTCRAALRSLHGVGAKVADCVSLMALDQPGAVPVDIHVQRLVRRCYSRSGGGESRGGGALTERQHVEIGDMMRAKFGPMAGWAQAVLFCAELPGLPALGREVLQDSVRVKTDNKDAKTEGVHIKTDQQKFEKKPRKRNKLPPDDEIFVRKSNRRRR